MSESLERARDILDTMLGFLGFVVHIEDDISDDGEGLQVFTEEAELLTGRRGERVDDIQYLVNRLLRIRDRSSPRIRIDVEHYRSIREDGLARKVKEMAEVVRRTGKPMELKPMNSYHRRIVHNLFKIYVNHHNEMSVTINPAFSDSETNLLSCCPLKLFCEKTAIRNFKQQV